MKNYADMSDDEINFEVAKYSFDAGWLDRHYGKEGMVPDYCSNWSDAGLVMIENKIGITFVNGEWRASSVAAGYHEFSNINALRAVCCCFLLMNNVDISA